MAQAHFRSHDIGVEVEKGASLLDAALADRIVLSKSDIAAPPAVARLRDRLSEINPFTPRFVASHGAICRGLDPIDRGAWRRHPAPQGHADIKGRPVVVHGLRRLMLPPETLAQWPDAASGVGQVSGFR